MARKSKAKAAKTAKKGLIERLKDIVIFKAIILAFIVFLMFNFAATLIVAVISLLCWLGWCLLDSLQTVKSIWSDRQDW